jgi:hypothetical protein
MNEFVTLPREVVEKALAACERRQPFSWLMPEDLNQIREALEQPQGKQEPVAWTNPRALKWDTHQSEKVVKLTSKAQPEYDFTVPLYIHSQPKREPLTDEQIDACFPVQWEGEFYKPWRKVVARAIERAHGIGSKA